MHRIVRCNKRVGKEMIFLLVIMIRIPIWNLLRHVVLNFCFPDGTNLNHNDLVELCDYHESFFWVSV